MKRPEPALLEDPVGRAGGEDLFHDVLPTLKTLFGSDGQSRQPVHFEWWLIRRKKRPFLLLPSTVAGVRVGLRLYAAQRWYARIWRALLPPLFKTPAAFLFDRVYFEADPGSEFMQFLARQCGVPATRTQAPAVRFAGEGERSCVVLLGCDKNGHPVKIAKVGLSSAGCEATNREADLLEILPNIHDCARITGRLNTPTLSAFATAYFPGSSPSDDAGVEQLFHGWLNPGSAVPLTSLKNWRELEAKVAEADPGVWQVLNARLAGKTVRTTVYHGDFAPWNISAVDEQNLKVYDWEHGVLQGIPGWDWFHFVVQTAILVKGHSAERVAAEVERLFRSERLKKYAAEAGIGDFVQPLLLAYLLHQKWVFKPLKGGQQTEELFGLLSGRWQMTPQPANVPAVASAESLAPGL